MFSGYYLLFHLRAIMESIILQIFTEHIHTMSNCTRHWGEHVKETVLDGSALRVLSVIFEAFQIVWRVQYAA